jgi:acetyl-CoA carboxylase carboxyl transferase subunit beta
MTVRKGKYMIGSKELIERVLDAASWEPWDKPVPGVRASGEYGAALDRARHATGLDEAVVTGSGAIGGHRVAVIATEFSFLAGSVGMAASRRIIHAVERATTEQIPVVASPASGGTRLQEGTLAFVQMIGIASALAAHRAAGLPYLVYLRDPTTGGVLASWGSLGHVTAAEPGALIGLLGPRVQHALYDEPLPPGIQTAENLYTHGLIDAVVSPSDLRDVAIRVLSVLNAPRRSAPAYSPVGSTDHSNTVPPSLSSSPSGADGTWGSVVRSRRPDRPGVRSLLKIAASDVTLLSGTGAGERDDALVLALARFGKIPSVVLGQDRGRQTANDALGPAGLREAVRGVRLASDLNLPLVTVIDTPGAPLSRHSEESGLASGIAWCLAELSILPAPTVCVLLGQGGGGTALALLPADRVLCAEHAWLAPLPPEGASEALYRTTNRASDVAHAQRIGSDALVQDGIADMVIPELPDAADEPEQFLRRVSMVLEAELRDLAAADPNERLAARTARFRAAVANQPSTDA